MENVLVVSRMHKSLAFLTETLNTAFCDVTTVILSSGTEARRQFVERNFDLVIINAPIADESGESLARFISAKDGTQVILIVESEIFDEMSSVTENDGILVVARPFDKNLLWSAFKLAQSTQSRLKKIRSENSKLKQKIEDIKIIDRAKWILVSNLKFSEQEAHRFIEKQAMDLRCSRREIAQDILKTYDG